MIPGIKNLFAYFRSNPKITFPFIITVWGIFYIMKGSVINAGNGFGYDGAWYAAITKNFSGMIANGDLSLYKIQRILPCVAVNILMTVFRIPFEDYFIIKSFQIYNLVLLSASALVWIKISELYNLSLKYVWIGFILGFINYGMFLMPFFYPVLTDISAFFLGFCLLYFISKIT